MPIPTPSEGETQDTFMGRCMGMLKDEKKPQKQKVAICFSQWRTAKKSSKNKKEENNDTSRKE